MSKTLDTPEAKRARLVALSRNSYVSHRGLAAVLDDVRKNGIPEASGRTAQYNARKLQARRQTPYGPLVRDVQLDLCDTDPVTISVQDPFAMLHVTCEESQAFSAMLHAAYQRNAPSADEPWRIILYADEIGHNPLLSNDTRKCQCMYWSFAELGPIALSSEHAWFIAAAVRSSLINKMESGMSQFFRFTLTEMFFNNSTGRNFSTGGCTVKLTIRGAVIHATIVARVRIVVGDEKALKEIFSFKGASGYKICGLCPFVVAHRTRADRVGPRNVLSTCVDVAQFGDHTDESIYAIVRELNELHEKVVDGRAPADRLEGVQRHFGYVHTPRGLLLDADLDVPPKTCIHFDWYHIFCINGIFQKEMQGLLVFLRTAKFAIPQFTHFISKFEWPRLVQHPREMFDGWDENKDHLKCDGHTCTASYEALAVFLETVVVPMGICRPQCHSFLKLCAVLDLLVTVRHGGVAPAQFMRTLVEFLKAHLDAYGTALWVPKHHLALHLASQLARHQTLICCNIHEIRHKLVKRWTKDRYTRTGFEAGCIEEVTLQHLSDLSGPWLSAGLVNPVEPRAAQARLLAEMFGADATIKTARITRANERQFVAGDLAFANSVGGLRLVEMKLHVCVDGTAITIVSPLEYALRASDTARCQTYKRSDAVSMTLSRNLFASASFCQGSDGHVTVLVPASVRMSA